MKKITLIFTLFLSTSLSLFGQQEATENQKSVVITLINGQQHIGKVVSDDGREILFNSETIGKIYIAKSEMKSMKDFEESESFKIDGESIVESPFTTRYSFTANAFPLKKNINYSMVNLYGPEIHFALSKRFSMGVMSTWIGSPLALNAKYSITTKEKGLNFSIGTIVGTSGYLFNGSGYGGLVWGTATLGSRMNNISASVGYGAIGNFNDATKYRGGSLFSIAGIYKIGKSTSFIFDSMLSYTEHDENVNIYGDEVDLNVDENYKQLYPSVYNVVKTQQISNINLVLMPGIRFQKKDDRAFQISLAGVIHTRNKKTKSFPIPMCSWLFKL